MPKGRKRTGGMGRRGFRPEPRKGNPPHACGEPGRQAARRQKTQASWRRRNPGYAIGWRIDQRAAQTQPPPERWRMPPPLNQLPWEFAKDEFGSQRADFIRVMGALIIRSAKDQFRAYVVDP